MILTDNVKFPYTITAEPEKHLESVADNVGLNNKKGVLNVETG